MTQPTKGVSEEGQGSISALSDSPKSLGETEVTMIRKFFELLAKWEEESNLGN